MIEHKVVEGLTPNTPQWEEAMKRATDASDKEKFIPVSKRKKKLDKPIKGGKE